MITHVVKRDGRIQAFNKSFQVASLVVRYISSVPKIILSFLLSAKLNQHYLHQVSVLKISKDLILLMVLYATIYA